MIKVFKTSKIPESLNRNTKGYAGEDVQRQLTADQYGKCYLCECSVVTDYQIDHLKSKANFPGLIIEWNNLLLACSYCNRKKSDSFDDILNPLDSSIEDEIEQKIDFQNNMASFKAVSHDVSHDRTVELLESIFNGKCRLRNNREKQFWNYVKSSLLNFYQIVPEKPWLQPWG